MSLKLTPQQLTDEPRGKKEKKNDPSRAFWSIYYGTVNEGETKLPTFEVRGVTV